MNGLCLLKVPHYAFADITFRLVCSIAVCECKRSEKLQRSKCTINGVIFSQKKEPMPKNGQ